MTKCVLLVALLMVMVPQRSHNQYTPLTDEQGCRMEYSSRSDKCIGRVRCKSTIDNIYSVINNWDCIKQRNYYDYSWRTYQQNYIIHLYLEDIYGDVSWNSLETYSKHIHNLYSTGGNQQAVPRVISDMNNIETFKLTDNEVQEIAINIFLSKQQMTMMNMSHNAITTVNGDYTSLSEQHALITIDLSYNLIEVLPGKVFASFINLKNLNLSYNNIKTIDMSTFEGMSHLEELDLSYNKLTMLGHAFITFINLNYLSLQHNQISELLESNLISLVKIVDLNISNNNIGNIETNAFRSLSKLSNLDISNNRIKIIKEKLFQNTTNLQTLALAGNNIEIIEDGAFQRNKITDFTIENNLLISTISKYTFAGLNVTSLSLCGGKIKKLDDLAFSNLSVSLVSLNLSTNLISNISTSAFKSLHLLTDLDLSNNKIKELNFDTSDISKLSIFYARNNSITKILKSMFGHLSSLEELDLSYNAINEIDSNTFDSLSELKKLLLNDNDLVNAIDANKFRGLIGVHRIDFTNSKLRIYKNDTFCNMTSLATFVSSHGQLTNVAYNAFRGTGSITDIDLSYNLLEDFLVNTTTIERVNTLYLNNNRLSNITNSTFFGLKFLQTLNLSSNDILHVETTSFQSLSSLLHIYLSSNLDLNLPSNVFDNLTWLEEVNLSNIRTKFNFINTTNSSISKLSLSQHFLENINDIFVFHVKNIGKLDLSWNKFTYVDKFSFQAMNSLTWLDLSNNLITDIQPGSFSHMSMINELNLHGNDIQTFQYGVLDGLMNLRILNLSDNALRTFEANVLHSSPHIQTISLDNNAIKSIVFNEFVSTPITLLYVGGNGIPCSSLVNLKYVPLNFNVTSEKLDFSSENVNGITCKTSARDVISEVYNNSDGNITWMFRELAKTVVDLQETIKAVANSTAHKEDVLTNALADVAKSVDVLAKSYNKSQIASEKNLNTFIRALDELDAKNRSAVTTVNTTSTGGLAADGNVAIRSTLKEMLLTFQHEARDDTDRYKDVRVLLHVIAVCMVLIFVLIAGYFLYNYVIKNAKMRAISSPCTQPIANAMEMD